MCKHYDDFLAKFQPDVTVWNKSKIAAIGTLSIIRFRVYICFIMRKIHKVRCLWLNILFRELINMYSLFFKVIFLIFYIYIVTLG